MSATENQQIESTQLADTGQNNPVLPFIGFEDDLKLALERKQLEIHMQPIISLGKWRLFGVELLLRWKHPQHGLILPEFVIPALDKAGLLHDTGLWIVDETSHMIQSWQENEQQPLHVFMNISTVQFTHDHFVDSLLAAADKNSLLSKYLILELSENCLAEQLATNQAAINRLKENGIKLALNYCGTELPQPATFNNLPVDYIKLNKTLVHQISHHQDKRTIMATISSFAHEHGLEVIAEGVETAEQLLFINALCCTGAQGFLLGHPLELSAFESQYHSCDNFEHLREKCSLSLGKTKPA